MKRLEDGSERRWRPAARIAFGIFLLIALFFLYTEHRAHLFGFLPYLLLAACPLMHLLHHHGGHRPHQHGGDDSAAPRGEKARSNRNTPDPHHHQP